MAIWPLAGEMGRAFVIPTAVLAAAINGGVAFIWGRRQKRSVSEIFAGPILSLPVIMLAVRVIGGDAEFTDVSWNWVAGISLIGPLPWLLGAILARALKSAPAH